jgi:hypothetical protein
MGLGREGTCMGTDPIPICTAGDDCGAAWGRAAGRPVGAGAGSARMGLGAMGGAAPAFDAGTTAGAMGSKLLGSGGTTVLATGDGLATGSGGGVGG